MSFLRPGRRAAVLARPRVDGPAEARPPAPVAVKRADRAARTRIEEVPCRPQRYEREAPDQEVVVALVAQLETEEAHCRDTRDSRMAPEKLEIAEEERDTDPPRDGRERKVMA